MAAIYRSQYIGILCFSVKGHKFFDFFRWQIGIFRSDLCRKYSLLHIGVRTIGYPDIFGKKVYSVYVRETYNIMIVYLV